MTSSSVSTAVLGAGYVLAVPFTVYTPGFLKLWRGRDPRLYAAAQVGAVLITAGWAVKGKVPSAAFNGLWLTGFGVAYALEGRKRARLSTTS